ncbi:hypothetical protein RDWZM_009771 [Blomia tropicalis]|uniref:Uncharacterized protein n=1 Tax=Blomia tropicalis TaxID=40697 RepID=A0A9Q0M497_BLOTA|nr:hypothetical protein BLOT_012803 [Blomia tropicalis]KAJ6218614.1 hypothetical protein RDWZM_009771 [Blomia tropicalis]
MKAIIALFLILAVVAAASAQLYYGGYRGVGYGYPAYGGYYGGAYAPVYGRGLYGGYYGGYGARGLVYG